MVPENEMVTNTDVPVKELSWIDRMYQNLESVCNGIDKNPSLLFQETSKYMEDQMNVVGTNVRKLYAELIQDLLPEPESSELAVTNPESADSESGTPEKQKTENKDREITQYENEKAGEDALDKGCDTATNVPEVRHISMGHTEIHKETVGKVGTSEIEACRPAEVTTQWESSSKAYKFEGHTSRLGESAVRSKVIGKETDMVLERCKGNCASYHEALQSVKDLEPSTEELIDGMRSDPKAIHNSLLIGCLKEKLQMVNSDSVTKQGDGLQEPSAQWFASEDHTKAYTIKSSLDSLDGAPLAQGPAEDLDLDWEFV